MQCTTKKAYARSKCLDFLTAPRVPANSTRWKVNQLTNESSALLLLLHVISNPSNMAPNVLFVTAVQYGWYSTLCMYVCINYPFFLSFFLSFFLFSLLFTYPVTVSYRTVP